MAPTYELGLGSGGNFRQRDSTVEAPTLKEAIAIAQEEHQGMLVYSGWATDQLIERAPGEEEEWMSTHRIPKNL